VHITADQHATLDGARGEPRRKALAHLVEVGRFFDAVDLVPVSQVHVMADTEALGLAGVEWLEELAARPEGERRVVVPTITDPRGADLRQYARIKQEEGFVDLERRAIAAFRALGVLLTDTCINYQTLMAPVFGEQVAFGDTGSAIYANSVCGARTNFEGGPSAIASALTGLAPRYGFRLDEKRRGTRHFHVTDRPRSLSDWGALGGLVGRRMRSYWDVPVLTGIAGSPTSDEIKHFGAALASYGSTALFHILGVTPEAHTEEQAFGGTASPVELAITLAEIDAFYESFTPKDDSLDVVVFAAPQLSLIELSQLATLLDGRRIHANVALIICTSSELRAAAERLGLLSVIEASGAILLEGVCFYQMHAREIGAANGWSRLMSNSAKLVNIIGGYGYEPVLAPMDACVRSAVAGRIVP